MVYGRLSAGVDRMTKLSTRTTVLWSIMMVFLIGYEATAFLRLRRQNFFSSDREMFLVIALIAVLLIGIVWKSRQNRSR